MKITTTYLWTALAAAIPAAATAQDWGGYYAGGSIGYETMSAEDLDYGDEDGDASFNPDGFLVAGFAGYNIQNNNIVYGFEAGASFNTAEAEDGTYLLPLEHKFSGTLRGRVGYATGQMLPYLALGYTFSKFEADHEGNGNGEDIEDGIFSGPTAAVGVDYAINAQMFGRFEVAHTIYRDNDLEFYDGSDPHELSASSTAVTLGIGYRF